MAASDLPNALKLETKEQKKALADLRSNSGIPIEEFHKLILLQLRNISNAENIYSQKRRSLIPRRHYSVSHAKIRHLRRSAQLARKMADRLNKDSENLRTFGLGRLEYPRPPLEQLRSYSSALESPADSDEKYVVRPLLQHQTTPPTMDIIALVRFVEQETGKPNWNKLTILIQAALGKKGFGFNVDRLRKLVEYHEKKYLESQGNPLLRAAARNAPSKAKK
jgi:hypothetical protein